ncbi:MAG: dimethyl sulfoxide reductase anchor subunit [Rhodospirillales bacterium]|nr:dimethyl sulfoxide reductase anchor subunit [Rhodospirillales bacterium]
MIPTFSIICFTVLSGAGYGLLALLGVLAWAGALGPDFRFGLAGFSLSMGAVTAGLAASAFHLGRPERAWRAFSQWRTSWLSREGVASIVTFAPAAAFAWGWLVAGSTAGGWGWAGLASAALATATVVCTAMIYRSLATIHQWANSWVVPGYLMLALMTGAQWLNGLAMLLSGDARFAPLAAASAAMALALKFGYWRFIDASRHPSTPETATGLGSLGRVRHFEGPHTEENYLTQEMGFRVARKHATKLRRLAAVGGFVLPMVLCLVAALSANAVGVATAMAAAVLATIGVGVERWLFFAEARHTVSLYYGATRA